jgi:aryl-alcohol dehydrogenase-like predicted oxidoreductase
VACSYGAPTAAFEEAFEQGVNYFVMSHQAVDVCMSGPKNIEEMRQALKAIQLGPLSGDELKRIQRIGDYVHANHRRFFG